MKTNHSLHHRLQNQQIFSHNNSTASRETDLDPIQNKENLNLPKKVLESSLRNNIVPDLDKLVKGLKIFPNSSSTYYINIILSHLKHLEKHPVIVEQIKAMILLMQSIEKKLYSNYLNENRVNMLCQEEMRRKKINGKTKTEQSQLELTYFQINCNPLKKIKFQAAKQNIQYEKFSLEQFPQKYFRQQIQPSQKQNTLKYCNESSHLQKYNKNSNTIVGLDKKQIFSYKKQSVDCEIDQLSREIRDLDCLLYKKNQNIQGPFKKQYF